MTLDEARIVIEAFRGHTLRPYQMRALSMALKMVDDAAMVIAYRQELTRCERIGEAPNFEALEERALKQMSADYSPSAYR